MHIFGIRKLWRRRVRARARENAIYIPKTKTEIFRKRQLGFSHRPILYDAAMAMNWNELQFFITFFFFPLRHKSRPDATTIVCMRAYEWAPQVAIDNVQHI